MSQVIFIVRHIFKLEQIRGGYQEHVYGENVGYIRKYGGLIYSLDQKTLFGPDLEVLNKYTNTLSFLIWLTVNIIRSKGKRFIIVMAYPTALRISYTIPLLFVLKMSGRFKITFSVHDLFLEQVEAFTGRKVWFGLRLIVRIIDFVYLNLLSDAITIPSNSYKRYVSQLYKINPNKIYVFPNSSFPDIIKPSHKPCQVFTVLYSGSIMVGKGVENMISVIRKLRKEGLDIKLILLGERHMALPHEDWIETAYVPFIQTPKFYDKTSVCIIPFPKLLHYDYSLPVKLFDYMAAGKPIISLNLKEVAEIIKKYDCGIVVNNYDDMAKAIKYLYKNRTLLSKLGHNGRKAVEEEFNWSKRVEELKIIFDQLFVKN